MSKSNGHSPTNGTRQADPAPAATRGRAAPIYSKFEPLKPDPKETAQESVHQVMPKAAAAQLVTPVPLSLPLPRPAPLEAAKGNDELMSLPPKKS